MDAGRILTRADQLMLDHAVIGVADDELTRLAARRTQEGGPPGVLEGLAADMGAGLGQGDFPAALETAVNADGGNG